MATGTDVEVVFNAKDNVSRAVNGMKKSIESIGTSARGALSSFTDSVGALDSMMLSGMSEVLGGKTISETIFGTTKTAETNKVLLANMTQTEAAAKSLYNTVDTVTNTSLISMQNLIPAMKAFKSATGASDSSMQSVVDEMANFGASVLATTGSTELAQQAMMDLSKGIKGAYASLDQYGISEDALMRTGLWSGKEDDVEGYMAAVTEVTGSTEELMNTMTGLEALMGKEFSKAGKQLGNTLLPFMKEATQGFIDLNKATGGNLAVGILAVGEGINVASQALGAFGMAMNGVESAIKTWEFLRDTIKGVVAQLAEAKAAQATTSIVSELTPEDIGKAQSHAGGFGGIEVGAGKKADVTKDTYMKDMLKYQQASLDDNLVEMERLEQKYSDMDLKSNRLKTKQDTTFKNLDKTINTSTKSKGLASKAGAASSGMKATSTSLRGLGSGALSMVAPLIQLGIAIAIIMPIIAGLAAEALLLIKGLGELVKALDFKSLKLDEQIDGIKQVGEAMWEVARTMGAMSLAGAATLVYSFISALSLFTDPIKTAVNEIKRVIPIINELGTVEPVNSNVVSNLQKVTSSMKAVSTAIGSMADTTWDVMMGNLMTLGGLFGNFSTNINAAKTDIINASKALNEMGDLQAIDPQVATNLKAVSESMKSVAEAIKSMSAVDWEVSFKGGNPFKQLVPAIRAAKEDIMEAAPLINSFSGMPKVDQETANKIKAVSDAMSSVASAIKSMSSVDWEVSFKGGNPFKNLIASLKVAKSDIWNAASVLSSLADMPAIPEGTGQKIQRVGWTATNVVNAIKTLNNVQGVELNAEALITTFQNAKNTLYKISAQLASLADISAIPEGLGDKIQRVGWTANTVSSTVQTINAVPAITGNGNVQMAVTAVKNTITQLNQLAGTSLNGNISSLLTTVTNTLNQLKATLTAMSGGFTASGITIGTSIVNGVRTGLAPLPSTVITAVSTATGSAASTGWTGGSRIGTSVTNGFKSALKLSAAMKTEMGYVTQAVNSGISAAKSAAQRGAAEVVEAFKRGIETGSPGAMAWAMFDEMHYIKDFIVSEGKQVISSTRNLAENIVDKFGNPNLTLGGINPVETYDQSTMQSIGENTRTITPYAAQQLVTINIGEGAIQLDARNLTTREAKQIMITALEGILSTQNVNIKQIGV